MIYPFFEVVIDRSASGFTAQSVKYPVSTSGSTLQETIHKMVAMLNTHLCMNDIRITEDNLILHSPDTRPRYIREALQRPVSTKLKARFDI